MNEKSEKSRFAAFVLCTFLGAWGLHRFYVGKVGTGLLFLFTFGLLGFGIIFDWFMILLGKFTDKKKLLVLEW